MARLGPHGHVRTTSGIPRPSDIPRPMSRFGPLRSGYPSGPDVGGAPAQWPSLTLSGIRANEHMKAAAPRAAAPSEI